MDEQISLGKDYEVRHWMRTLAGSELELFRAVNAVGTRVDDVRRYLHKTVESASRWNSLSDRSHLNGRR